MTAVFIFFIYTNQPKLKIVETNNCFVVSKIKKELLSK